MHHVGVCFSIIAISFNEDICVEVSSSQYNIDIQLNRDIEH